jgi:hypothetical protein
MEQWTPAVWIAAGMLALNLIQRLFGGGWNLQKTLGAMELRLKEAIAASKKEIEEQQRAAAHEFGETVSALKEHVRQVEFHIRDNYIRKDDFMVHMKSNDELLRLNFDNITQRLERIEKRLDHTTT